VAALAHGNRAKAANQLADLIARAPLGLHLTKPWQVALAGRPNVGKSSLLNALCGYERAIVHSTPGTTRDLVSAQTAIDGWPVQLIDTAGLHASSDPLETAGMELARSRLVEADLVLLVFEATADCTDDDNRLLAEYPSAVRVANKCDLLAPGDRSSMALEAILTSALTGEGLAELLRLIADCLVPRPPQPGEAVPFLEEHCTVLDAAAASLVRGDTSDARLRLEKLLRSSS
jgi:tRNA modification GTPase